MSRNRFQDAEALQQSKALELIMRDVLDGLEEFANMASYNPNPEVLTILSIEPPSEEERKRVFSAPSGSEDGDPDHVRRGNKTADIVSFIEKRELIAMRNSA